MSRLDIRIDTERKRKLAEIAAEMGTSVSDVVRRLVDTAHAQVMARKRREAAQRLGSMATHDPGDPEELSWELDGAHDSGLR
jgi:negative regulator of replication initiation